jgi:hypothetical protein
MKRLTCLLTGLAVTLAACADDQNAAAPTPTVVNVPVSAESFVGTMALGGSRFYSFSVTREGPVYLTLITLTESGTASTAVVSLGLGIPSGTTCAVSSAATTAAGPTPQVAETRSPGIYCARVSDLGFLTAAADFVINIAHP